MTLRQKRIVVALTVVNALVILTLVVLVTRPAGIYSVVQPTSTHRVEIATPRLSTRPRETTTARPAALQETCEWQAAQLLARSGLGGTVALAPGEELRFEIAYSLAPDQTADEAAQSVWAAFDIALALGEAEKCAPFSQIEVTIIAQGDQRNTQISASASATDLKALSAGEMSEDEFIDRVAYNTIQAPQ